MIKTDKAKTYRSKKVRELLNKVTPLEAKQIRKKMIIAAQIEEFMKQKGWSKSQFAKEMGRSPSEITKWLSGTHNFTIDMLLEIAHVLGIEITALFNKKKDQIVFRTEIVVSSEGTTILTPQLTVYNQGVILGYQHYTA